MIDLEWQFMAECKNEHTAMFYVDEKERPEAIAVLRSMCVVCPVIEQCLAHALMWEAYGFWANTTESERHVLRRSMRLTRRPIRLSYLGNKLMPQSSADQGATS